jgi:hypothetical protein
MGKKDPRVDAYIAKSADFARPILKHLRKVVHGASPEVEETLKWGSPIFVYRGIVAGMAALRRNKKALATFEGFSHSHKHEYVEWVTEARTEETRRRRLETALEWMAEGKSRNWKYMRK